MPKMKTTKAAAKRFKKTGTGLLKEKQSLQEPYLNKEISEEKKKPEKSSYHRCNQRKSNQENFTVHLITG